MCHSTGMLEQKETQSAYMCYMPLGLRAPGLVCQTLIGRVWGEGNSDLPRCG